MSPSETIGDVVFPPGFASTRNEKTDYETEGVPMTEPAVDHPDIVVFPPVIPLTALVAACVLQWLAPLGWIADIDSPVRIGIGAIVVLSGLITISAGRRALVQHGTSVNPLQPTTALVTGGIFSRTRNPLYVGA